MNRRAIIPIAPCLPMASKYISDPLASHIAHHISKAYLCHRLSKPAAQHGTEIRVDASREYNHEEKAEDP
jgi:hypothetical protein